MEASPYLFLQFSALASQKPVWASMTNRPSFTGPPWAKPAMRTLPRPARERKRCGGPARAIVNEPGQAGCAGRRAAKATAFTLVGYSRPRPRECGRSPGGRQATIFIAAKFRVLPADADRWPDITGDFTGATRTEPGCLWFDWSRSLALTTPMSTC